MATTKFNMSRTVEERFWEKVEKTPYCWVWTGASSRSKNHRKGRFYLDEKLWLASRFMWVHLLNRPLPDGHFVLHTCDNGLCVRPEHLFSGTQKDNMQDAVRKGRMHLQSHPKNTPKNLPWPRLSGEGHPNARLDANQAREIFKSNQSAPALAKIYGVSKSTIRDLRAGITWAGALQALDGGSDA